MSVALRFCCGLLLVGGNWLMAVDSPWRSTRLHETFVAEGASVGDLDGDGWVDLIVGPTWYRGPNWTSARPLAPPRTFPVVGYSDQFFSHVVDVDGDGANDVLAIGFPGKPARWYRNPGSDGWDRPWPVTEITGPVDNESPAIVDLIPGGLPEIVCGNETQYGYYQAGPDATKPWVWHPISRPGSCPGKFAHGLGVGDIDGDGKLDILDKNLWWKHSDAPESDASSHF